MPPPVILVSGDDDLLLQRETQRVVEDLRAEADGDGGVDVEVYDVSETEHLPEMRTASLFGGRTCVVLRGAEGLAGDLKAEVEGYLDDPSSDAVLVIVARGTNRIRKIASLADEEGEVREVSLPRDWDDSGWARIVGEEFRRAGRKADAGAIAALRSHAGNDAAAIASKVGQVVAATDPGAAVGAEDVEAVVEGHGRVSGFAIADAVADRDPAATLVALRGALESGEAPLAILGSVTYRIRQLVQVRGGVRPSRMSPGQYRRLQGIVRNFGPGELPAAVDRLARADLDLKGSDLPQEMILELALLDVATARGDRRAS